MGAAPELLVEAEPAEVAVVLDETVIKTKPLRRNVTQTYEPELPEELGLEVDEPLAAEAECEDEAEEADEDALAADDAEVEEAAADELELEPLEPVLEEPEEAVVEEPDELRQLLSPKKCQIIRRHSWCRKR